MKQKLETRSYTNFILTVIAVLLLALTVREYGIPMVSSVQAQDEEGADATSRSRRISSSMIDQTVPQQQDLAVAGATSEVAAANREIAQAIRELAKSVESAASEMKADGATGSAAKAAKAPAARPAAPGPKPVVEVGPRR